jgi:hypothetical protein
MLISLHREKSLDGPASKWVVVNSPGDDCGPEKVNSVCPGMIYDLRTAKKAK